MCDVWCVHVCSGCICVMCGVCMYVVGACVWCVHVCSGCMCDMCAHHCRGAAVIASG